MPQVSREDGILLWCDAIHKQDNFLYYVEIFMKWKFKELLKIDWCFWRAWVVLSGPVSLQLWWVLVVQEKWLWSGRKTGGYIKGDIKISGYPKKQETFFFFLLWAKWHSLSTSYRLWILTLFSLASSTPRNWCWNKKGRHLYSLSFAYQASIFQSKFKVYVSINFFFLILSSAFSLPS